MSKRSSLEIYRAANKQFSWRLRDINGRLLSVAAETFKDRASLANNLSANFGLCLTSIGIKKLAGILPCTPGESSLTFKLNNHLVEIKGPPAPRRPRTHTQHARKATPNALK